MFIELTQDEAYQIIEALDGLPELADKLNPPNNNHKILFNDFRDGREVLVELPAGANPRLAERPSQAASWGIPHRGFVLEEE